MKKMRVFLALIILGIIASSAFGQKVLVDQKKVNDLTRKISECKIRLNRLNSELANLVDYSGEVKKINREIDSLNKVSPLTGHGQKLKDLALAQKTKELKQIYKKQSRFSSSSWKQVERDSLAARVKRYENQKNNIFESYITDNSVPKELTPREEDRRERGLNIRKQDRIETNSAKREDLVFNKLKDNPVLGDKYGFKGFVANDYATPVVFKFTPLDGGESKSPLVAAHSLLEEKLIPGIYQVSFFSGGRELGKPIVVSVNSVITTYNGISCHWYVYMPNY